MKPSYIRNSFLKTINSMGKDPSPFVKRPGVDFSRNRKCPFHLLLQLILSMESHSLNRELRRFFSMTASPVITRSAFIQQRMKLNDTAFPFLFSALNGLVPFKKTFHGYHLLACDGSDLNVPPLDRDDTTRVDSNTSGVCYHQIHLNALYDILEERYTDILLQPRSQINERQALLSFLSRNTVPGKCIFIADRGYFSLNVLAHLLRSSHSFLLRVNADDLKTSFFRRFDLPDLAQYDTSLTFFVTRSKRKIYRDHPEKYVCIRRDRPFDLIATDDRTSVMPLSCRLVKLQLPGGGSEFLITNLPKESFPKDVLGELYRLRWGIETAFRFLKYNVALNSFHSVRRDLIVQETYARMILYNFTMMIVHTVPLPQKATKYQRKISVSDAVVTCRDFLIHRVKNAEIESSVSRYLTDVRPNRTFPRKKRSKRYISFNNRN